MAEMKIAGEMFNVRVEGPEKAPVIMLSNSLGTNLRMWDGQVSVLSKHFKVVRYDSRGHGKSPVSGGAYSIAGLGRDALAIMDALELDRVHWLGLSKGGMVGQWLLVNARERIGRAVLANTAAQLGTPDMWNTRIRTVLSQGMGAIIPAVIDRWFTAGFQLKAPADIARVAEMLRSTPAHGYAGCCAALRDMDLRDAIRSVSNPVLVVTGKHDAATSPEAGALIASIIRGARLVSLEAAHLSNIEAEAEFNKVVLGYFLDSSLRFAPPAKAPLRAAAVKTAAKPAGKSAGRKAKTGKAETVKAKPPIAKPAVAKTAKAKAGKGKAGTVKAGTVKTGKSAAARKPAKPAAARKTVAKPVTAAAKASARKKTLVKKASVKKSAARTAAITQIARSRR